MRANQWLPYAVLLVAGMAAASADDKPNFTGVWELTSIERDGATIPAGGGNAFGETQVWQLEGPKLTIKMTSRRQNTSTVTELAYSIGGEAGVVGHRVRADKSNPPINGSAHWEGTKLVYEQEMVNPSPNGVRRIIRTCALDGSARKLACDMAYWMGESSQRLEEKWALEKTVEKP
jgi:hypothetical protein